MASASRFPRPRLRHRPQPSRSPADCRGRPEARERRQRECDRAFMAPLRHPFETRLHRQHVACERPSTALRVNPSASPSSNRGRRRLFWGAPPARGICLTAPAGAAACARVPAATARPRR
jgi:hypothetical protein